MTATELVEVVASALYLSVVSFPGELHPPLSDLRQREQEKYHRHARAVLDALAEAGNVEWGALTRGRKVPYRYVKEQDARNSAKANHGVLVSRLTLPWTAAE